MAFNITNFVRTGSAVSGAPRYFVYTTDDTWFDIDETPPPYYFSEAMNLIRFGDFIRVVANDDTKLVQVVIAGGSSVQIAPLETL